MSVPLPLNTNLDNGFNFMPIPGSENQSLSIDESNPFPAALNHSESKSTIIHHDMQLDGSTNDNLQRQPPMQQEDIMPQSEAYFATNYDETKEQQVTTKPRKITLTKYTIYVTTHRMYIVGSNGRETVFRILEIDLTSTDKLIIMEDSVYFTRNEIMDVLNGLEETSEGGLTKKITAVGLLGFIRFTKHYYLCVVTKRRPVAILGGNYLYHIDATDLIPVTSNPKKPDRNSEELRYITTFQNIELNKTFYYSYNYDLTNSLQVNFLRNKKQSLGLIKQDLAKTFEFNDRFVWNSALLKPVFQSFDRVYDWFQPIIHGFIDQVNISIFDVHVYVTLIARRSHHFAGARFFKRGVNDTGDVANEVETEQIVSDMLTTPFHDPSAGFYNNNRYTSFVQHRGSIPLSWSQETAPNIRMTKPPINLNVVDPFYSTSALHFDDLFKRYGAPVQVLNLIKQREKTPRETKLLKQFEDCIDYLNKFLPSEKKIDYTAWDMSRASKSRGQDVIQWLENYSEKTLQKTGFFRNGLTLKTTKLQQGICRTNCIDCLDRTNTAQFVIGKRALGHQLHALGLIKEKYLEYDSDAINILTEMFHDHGDTIALQYGGSHLVNTLQTYRKINQWTSHSRDMIESVKRFYSNSFIDAQRQEAINLFLGNYVYEKGLPMLWDLNTDYYLHNNYEGILLNYKPSYTHWYSDCYLKDQKMELVQMVNAKNKENNKDERLDDLMIEKIDPYQGCFDNYWNVRYVPRELTTFGGLFEYNMNSTVRFNADQQQSSQLSHNQTKETASINSGGFISESTKSRARERIRRLTMNADDESTATNNLTVVSELDEENYISPFKSRKPHRELKFLTFDDDDNNELKNSSDKLQESNKDNTENELKDEEVSQLKFNHHQFNKLKDSHDMLVDQLISKSSKIDEHIRNSQQLPVIDIDDNSLIYNYDTLGYIEESYFDDTFIYRGDKTRNPDMTQDSNSNNSLNEDDPNEARDEGDITKELEADPLFNDLCKDYTNTLPSVTLTNLTCYQTSVNIEQELKIINANDYYFNDDEREYELIKAPGISLTSFQQYRDTASNSGVLQPMNKNQHSIPNIRRSLSPLNLLDNGIGAGITATLSSNNYHQHNDDELSDSINNNYNHVENNTSVSHELNDNYFSFSHNNNNNNNNNNGGAHNSSSYIEDDTNDDIILSDKYTHAYPRAGDGIRQNHGHGHNSSVIIHKRKNWNDDDTGGLRNDNGLNSPFLQVNTNSHDRDSLHPNGKSDGLLYDSLLKGKKLPVLID